jgi:hypothetical protein
MRLAAVAAVLLATTSPVFAQGIEPLRDAMSKMPETLLTNPSPTQFDFLDMTALHTLTESEGGTLGVKELLRALMGGGLPAFRALQISGPDAWNERAKIDVKEVRYFAGFGEPPRTVTLWGLADDAAAAALIEALDADDFDPVGTEGIIGNGTPMKPDLQRRDPINPWRTTVGAATFAAASGNGIIQSTDPDVVADLLGDGPSLADNVIVDGALGGVEAALGDDMIVQAMLISPVFGIAALDPSMVLTPGADMDTIREKLMAEMEAGTKGIPPYFGGVIADIEGDSRGVVISLAYPDCEVAGTAAEQMAQRWGDLMPEAAQGDMETSSVEGDGICAATLKVVNDRSEGADNIIFRTLFEAYLRRNFTVLQIGEGPEA